MHAALSVPRVHHPKNHILGRFEPSTCMVVVDRPKGPHFRTVGRAKGVKVWLLPEEALYLLERGSLDVRWPVSADGEEGEDDVDSGDDGSGDEGTLVSGRGDMEGLKETRVSGMDVEEQEGIPMSLQGAYTAFLGMQLDGPDKLTLEQYVVYTSLKRLGYIVMRAKKWDGNLQPDKPVADTQGDLQAEKNQGLFSQLWEWLFGSRYSSNSGREATSGSLVKPGLYRNYGKLNWIPLMSDILIRANAGFQMIFIDCCSLICLVSQQLRIPSLRTLLPLRTTYTSQALLSGNQIPDRPISAYVCSMEGRHLYHRCCSLRTSWSRQGSTFRDLMRSYTID